MLGAAACGQSGKRDVMVLFVFKIYTETQAEGEAGSVQGARRGTRSRDPGVTPRAGGGRKAEAQPPSHPRVPNTILLTRTERDL